MTTSALIIIDIQNDYFPDFPECRMPLPHMNEAADNASLLLNAARARREHVIHIQHIMPSVSAPFFRPDTKGCEIHPSVAPRADEMLVIKGRPNAFVGTELKAHLRDKGITHLTLCGAMSQMCVDATARAAVDMGFVVTVAQDACAAANVSHGDVDVPAQMVHAAIMAPLSASYCAVRATSDCL